MSCYIVCTRPCGARRPLGVAARARVACVRAQGAPRKRKLRESICHSRRSHEGARVHRGSGQAQGHASSASGFLSSVSSLGHRGRTLHAFRTLRFLEFHAGGGQLGVLRGN
eukprot:scaffold10723_cov113-Isochrysis_galbana.AAC.3